MARLEDLKEGAKVNGIRPDGPVTIINVKWHGNSVVKITYKDSSGRPGSELIFRNSEPDFGVTSVNYDLRELVANAESPLSIPVKEKSR